MGSGESKPDPAVEIERQLLKRQREYEKSVLETTPHRTPEPPESPLMTQAGKIGFFLRERDFTNFNKTTSDVIKFIQVLDRKYMKLFWTQFRSFYRASGEESLGGLSDDVGIDARYEPWSDDVKKVLLAEDFPDDFNVQGLKPPYPKEVHAFEYMQRQGWKIPFTATKFTEVVNQLRHKSIVEGGQTGKGVWHYD